VPVAPWMSLGLALLGLPRTPWAFQLSDGRVLVAGPDRAARKLDVGGDGSWSAVDNMLSGSRDAGSAVLVPGATDRVLVIGGRNPATSSCEVLDVPVSGVWVSTGSMTRARRHHNATILADGSVLVTGGTLIDDALEHAVLPAERWMASTGIWTTLASMNVSRRRGSVALLLPDGRVLCAGGGDGTAGSELHADAQIYSPPYLFQGARPTITTAPATLVYGSSFNVDSPQAPDVDTVWLVRSGSVTRGFNSDQRALSLPFTLSPGQPPGKSCRTAPSSRCLGLVISNSVP